MKKKGAPSSSSRSAAQSLGTSIGSTKLELSDLETMMLSEFFKYLSKVCTDSILEDLVNMTSSNKTTKSKGLNNVESKKTSTNSAVKDQAGTTDKSE